MITLVNPSTGARFQYEGTWLRNSPATDSDIRAGRAQLRGDKVWLDLPPGVQAQLDKGVLQYASEYEERGQWPAAPGPLLAQDQAGGVPVPPASAAHADWAAFAVSQGMDLAGASGMTRDQIRLQFCGSARDAFPDVELLDGDPGARTARRR